MILSACAADAEHALDGVNEEEATCGGYNKSIPKNYRDARALKNRKFSRVRLISEACRLPSMCVLTKPGVGKDCRLL